MKKFNIEGEWLKNKLNQGLSDREISWQVGCSTDTISRNRKQLHLLPNKKKHTYYDLKNTPLDDLQKGILIGMLLGDACIGKAKKGCFLIVEHSIAQKELVEVKWKLFRNIVIQDIQYREPGEFNKHTGNGSFKFSSILHPDLSKFREMFYKDGRKRVTKEIMEALTLGGLAMWYMDDGSYGPKQKQYYLSTCAFSLEEQKLMREMLRRKFNIWTSIVRDQRPGKIYYKLYITSRSKSHFEELIFPFIIKSMRYKIGCLGSPETICWPSFEKKDDDIVRAASKGAGFQKEAPKEVSVT